MIHCCILLVAFVQLCACDYRKDGDFILGAILPLSKPDGSGNCNLPIAKGIAVAEAYINAIERLKMDDHFKQVFATYNNMIGYDIRDNCNDLKKEKDIAYNIGKEVLAHSQNTTKPRPPDIILSPFTKESLPTVYVLNAENIPQISYTQDNAKLTTAADINQDNVVSLASAYPDNIMKMNVIFDLLKEYMFMYVHVVVSDDYQGKAGLKLIKDDLMAKEILTSDHLITSKPEDIKKVIDEFKKNPLVTVVIIHCTKEAEMELYKELHKEKVSGLTFISTQNWHLQQDVLKQYPDVVEGMIYVQYEDEYKSIENYFTSAKIGIPFTSKDWILPLFEAKGGKTNCLQTGASLSQAEQQACDKAEKDTQLSLADEADVAVNAFIATYIIMNAVKVKEQGESLVDAMKLINFNIPYLPQNNFVMSKDLTLDVTMFKLYNVQGKTMSDFSTKWIGFWDKSKTTPYQGSLRITKGDIRWKDGAKEAPVSTCAEPCKKGYKMILTHVCWICEKCPNGTVSNVTNAKKCMGCAANTVPKPDQSGCAKYELIKFHWFSPMGSFIIFLIVAGVCVVLFGLGILSQNSDHDLVEMCGYKLMCVYLLGCLLLFLAPVPLLVEPTVATCSAYISFFNIGMTLCFAVLMARSALVNGFYDEEGNATGGCSQRPRVMFVILIVGIQVLVMMIGLIILPPETQHNDTDQWNQRYFECSSWASYIFWIGFGYNIALSIIGNFLSCSSTKMLDACQDLKWILITYCIFYVVSLFEIVVFYRYVDEELAQGQAFMCIIFGFLFFFCYLWPKLFFILFRKNHEIQKHSLLNNQDDNISHNHHATAHASDGFKHHGIIQMRIKDESADA